MASSGRVGGGVVRFIWSLPGMKLAQKNMETSCLPHGKLGIHDQGDMTISQPLKA